jgi:hypothetical protein
MPRAYIESEDEFDGFDEMGNASIGEMCDV